MRISTILLSAMAIAVPAANAQEAADSSRSIKLYDEAVFYDGYNGTVFDAALEDGILRHSNSLYAKRMTDEQLDWFGSDVTMNVVIGALCDNYDRIGNINLAFVPKGSETYVPNEVTRIELARFITPFMDKNKQPDEVPYTYSMDALSLIMHDTELRASYDYWLEFELFGVPYAANEQVAGCKGRNDVFRGSLEFTSVCDAPSGPRAGHVLLPIVMKKNEAQGHNMNNYSELGTDTIGLCTKTWEIDVPADLSDARLTLIMSNHGANAGGEEYNRRLHYVYVDDVKELMFKPGGKSCEPYRVYNTQPNGIYGTSRPEDSWKKNSNWCPGAAIPTRELNLGALSAGKHKIRITVTRTVFPDKQGDFPVSMYLQGVTEGALPAAIFTQEYFEPKTELRIDGDIVRWTCEEPVADVAVYSMAGELLYIVPASGNELSLSRFDKGMYVIVLTTRSGRSAVRKVVR